MRKVILLVDTTINDFPYKKGKVLTVGSNLFNTLVTDEKVAEEYKEPVTKPKKDKKSK